MLNVVIACNEESHMVRLTIHEDGEFCGSVILDAKWMMRRYLNHIERETAIADTIEQIAGIRLPQHYNAAISMLMWMWHEKEVAA
ncbi:MAG: hypothetical protein ACXWQR_20925 [Ktedonobacterales bacterium]